MNCNWIIREAEEKDIPRIRDLYNQGILDRIATLEEQPKNMEEMHQWFHRRSPRYAVLVAEVNGEVQGWASLNPYSHRCAYAGVADLSVYIDRSWRGKGFPPFAGIGGKGEGKRLLQDGFVYFSL